jgi:hypothetical protein
MAGKIGEEFAKDMADRGWRELGGAMYPDSNIAQPMYPRHGRHEVSKEAESPGLEEYGSTLDARLNPPEASRDDHGQDGPEIDR